MARWDEGNKGGNTIPPWFFEAVEHEAEARTVEVEDCDVAYRYWDSNGDGKRPGMLLIHGMNAHSHWWDFIAPQLLDSFQVAAMDLTGMGDSDFRYEYDSSTFAQEIVAVLDDAGFGNDTIVVAHSFGGNMAVKTAGLYSDRFASLILVDSGIRHPDEPLPDRPMMMGGRAKVYPDKRTALARFRLQPAQPCDNTYILEYIARHSLLAAEGGGWTWKFDEDLLTSLKDGERQASDYQALTRHKLGLIYGADSELFSARSLEYMRELIPQEFPAVAIADAQHHVFLDQPLAFVQALKEMAAEMVD